MHAGGALTSFLMEDDEDEEKYPECGVSRETIVVFMIELSSS